jgi:hypothetical protein
LASRRYPAPFGCDDDRPEEFRHRLGWIGKRGRQPLDLAS